MADKTTTPPAPETKAPTPITVGGITFNRPSEITDAQINQLESGLSQEFKNRAENMEKLAAVFQKLKSKLPSDIPIVAAYQALMQAGGNINAIADPKIKEAFYEIKDVPVIGALHTADTVKDFFLGFFNTGVDAVMLVPRMVGATYSTARDFYHSFDPKMSPEEARRFAVLYSAMEQEGISAHDALEFINSPFDDKDSKVGTHPVEYFMAAVKHYGAKLAAIPVLREIISCAISGLEWIGEFAKEPGQRFSFSQLYARNMAWLTGTAQTIGTVEDLARGDIMHAQRGGIAERIKAFFGEQSLQAQAATAAGADQAVVQTAAGTAEIKESEVTEGPKRENHYADALGNLPETLSNPYMAAGGVAAVGTAYAARKPIGNGLAAAGKLTVNAGAGTVNLGAQVIGGTAAGLADGLGRTAQLGDTTRVLGGNTAAGNAVRSATNAVVGSVNAGAAKLTGEALAHASAASAAASRSFRLMQGAGKLAGRASAPVSGLFVLKDGADAIYAAKHGDYETATRESTSVGMVVGGAGVGFALGGPPGALIGAGIAGIVQGVNEIFGDPVGDLAVGALGVGKPEASAQTPTAEEDSAAKARRDAEERGQALRAAREVSEMTPISRSTAMLGAMNIGGDSLGALKSGSGPAGADIATSFLAPQAATPRSLA